MNYKIYGQADQEKAPSESVEMATFFSKLRREYPDTYGAIACHIRNEGKKHQAEIAKIGLEGGMIKGASDIFIPGAPSFLCELKSRKKGSRPSKEQIIFLNISCALGAFGCIAYGYQEAWKAFEEWKR